MTCAPTIKIHLMSALVRRPGQAKIDCKTWHPLLYINRYPVVPNSMMSLWLLSMNMEDQCSPLGSLTTHASPRTTDTMPNLCGTKELNHHEEGRQPQHRETGMAKRRTLVVSFAGLQRMRLRKLQIELVNRVIGMHFKGEEPSDWEMLLKEYSKRSPS